MGVTVPRFCYHSQLPIAGNCRMCLVEVEKITETRSIVRDARYKKYADFYRYPISKKRRVLEFLLLNHPLDCPICDQGGR